MKRLALPLATAALLALGGLVVVDALRPSAPPTAAEKAQLIASELRCPDCQALSVAESQTAAAAAIRVQIVEQLAAGKSPDEVRAYFVARYGEWILLAPRSPVAWLLPAAGVVFGVGALALWLRGGRPAAPLPATPAADLARERIRDEVERLDA